jgi:hypothetical protein
MYIIDVHHGSLSEMKMKSSSGKLDDILKVQITGIPQETSALRCEDR